MLTLMIVRRRPLMFFIAEHYITWWNILSFLGDKTTRFVLD